MGKWFYGLERKYKIFILIIAWTISLILILAFDATTTDEEGSGNVVLAFLWILELVFAILFSIWFHKSSKKTNVSKKENNLMANIHSNSKSCVYNKEYVENDNRYNYIKQKKSQFDELLVTIPKYKIEIVDENVKRKMAYNEVFPKSNNITTKTDLTNLKDFVVIDTETTGLNVGGNDIIEVSAIRFVDFKPSEIFSTFLKPRKSIPVEASRINGITDDMVKNSPKFGQIKKSLEKFIGNSPLVAHNAPFDLKFLFASGLDFIDDLNIYDTLTLSRNKTMDIFGKELYNYKLSTVCNECDIFFDGAHRSSADALATGLLFTEIIKRVSGLDIL